MEIAHIKSKCDSYIEDSWEDTWSAYSYDMNNLLQLRAELMALRELQMFDTDKSLTR